MVTHKKIEPFWVIIWFMSGDVQDNVSYVAVIFDKDIPLELGLTFDSTTSDDLSCKYDMEEIIFCE